jgi:hypothetical protein
LYSIGIDGRPLSVIPWNEQVLVGTTEAEDGSAKIPSVRARRLVAARVWLAVVATSPPLDSAIAFSASARKKRPVSSSSERGEPRTPRTRF